ILILALIHAFVPWCCCVAVVGADFSDVPPGDAVRSLAEQETVLPCVYKPTQEETTVQVTWSKERSDGTKEQIILAHHINGQTAFGAWSRRVRFKNSDPTVDSSLIITSTELGDAGRYSCQISTFPLGNFEKDMELTVWTIPISSLEPVVLVEGSYGVAATCRSTAQPTPQLSWDTDLTGQSTNRTYDNGVVTSQYALYPLRSMNDKKLDCLVWHESFKAHKRISNKLVVHYPPHAEITGFKGDWHLGLEKAALKCVSGGNPAPHLYTWQRDGEDVPEGAVPQPDGTLLFERPLSLSDAGMYQCVADNNIGIGKAELMCVFCDRQEISTLSRQASIRRMNSVSTDTRGATEENIPLRVEGTLRTSLSSLGVSLYVTVHVGPGPGREALLSYVCNNSCCTSLSNITEVVRHINGGLLIPSESGGSRQSSIIKTPLPLPPMSSPPPYPPVTDDEDEVDEGLGGPTNSQDPPEFQDSETNSSQVSYPNSNGSLRPKIRPLTPIVSPHLVYRPEC
uniref:Ig-like domain-containing protein n=1 Tax=Periophthalmus magnuspinnatus TaxID=409849 RepID=A0A3B3ZE94_9GOBI